MNKEAEAADNVLKLIELSKQQIETYYKLEKALRIASICPDVFKEGPVSMRVSRYPVFSYTHKTKPKLDGVELILTDAKGKEFLFPIEETPRSLWPTDIRTAVEGHEKYLERKKLKQQEK